jgi:hypothetical protein
MAQRRSQRACVKRRARVPFLVLSRFVRRTHNGMSVRRQQRITHVDCKRHGLVQLCELYTFRVDISEKNPTFAWDTDFQSHNFPLKLGTEFTHNDVNQLEFRITNYEMVHAAKVLQILDDRSLACMTGPLLPFWNGVRTRVRNKLWRQRIELNTNHISSIMHQHVAVSREKNTLLLQLRT